MVLDEMDSKILVKYWFYSVYYIVVNRLKFRLDLYLHMDQRKFVMEGSSLFAFLCKELVI